MAIESQVPFQQQQQVIYTDNEKLSWTDLWGRYRAQSYAMLGGTLLLIPGGMHISMGVFHMQCDLFACSKSYLDHLVASWFVACALGILVSAVLLQKHVRRIFFNFIGGALIVLASILLIIQPRNDTVILCSRYAEGIGHGIILVYAIIHSAEVSSKVCRGNIVGSVNLCITAGIIIHTKILGWYAKDLANSAANAVKAGNVNEMLNILKGSTSPTFEPNQVCGGIALAIAIVGLLCAAFLRYDSPIELIQMGKEDEAYSLLLKLQHEFANSPRIQSQFDELKSMINEDKGQGLSIFSDHNLIAFMRVLILRVLTVLATALFINYALIVGATFEIGPNGFILVMLIRILGEIINLILVDRFGRHKPFVISTAISGFMLIGLGAVLVQKQTQALPIVILGSFFQFFFGLGLSNTGMIYMGEAFPTRKKAFSISTILIIECFLQIMISIIFIHTMSWDKLNEYAFVIATFHITIAGLSYKFLPETMGISLKQCRNILKE